MRYDRLLRTILGMILCIFLALQAEAEKTNKILTTKDGWPLKITYYPSSKGKDSPVVVFLSGTKEHRGFWEVEGKSWPEKLQKKGMACITVDLRKVGESKPPGVGTLKIAPADYRNMATLDLPAVKTFIFKEHQAERLNMRKLAFVASRDSCPAALYYSAVDWSRKPWPDSAVLAARTPRGQDVRMLVLISPEEKVAGLPVNDAISALRVPARDIAVLTLASAKDKEDQAASHEIYEKFKAAEHSRRVRVFKLELNDDARGIPLVVGEARAEKVFFNFMEKYLAERAGSWVDRKSPLDTRLD